MTQLAIVLKISKSSWKTGEVVVHLLILEELLIHHHDHCLNFLFIIYITNSGISITNTDISILMQTGPWLYGSWIYNYLCDQCLSPLMLWFRISIRARYTTLCDKVCQWLATGRWFSPGPPVSSTNKTDRHDITEILLKVVSSIMKQTIIQVKLYLYSIIPLPTYFLLKKNPYHVVVWRHLKYRV